MNVRFVLSIIAASAFLGFVGCGFDRDPDSFSQDKQQRILLRAGHERLKDLPYFFRADAAKAVYSYLANDFPFEDFMEGCCHSKGLTAVSEGSSAELCRDIERQCQLDMAHLGVTEERFRFDVRRGRERLLARFEDADFRASDFLDCMRIVEKSAKYAQKLSCETPFREVLKWQNYEFKQMEAFPKCRELFLHDL